MGVGLALFLAGQAVLVFFYQVCVLAASQLG